VVATLPRIIIESRGITNSNYLELTLVQKAN